MPPPTHAQQPRARGDDWRMDEPCELSRAALPPTVERRARGARIDALDAQSVLARVVQRVGGRVAHFSRRPQRARVVAIGEHTTAAPDLAVESARDAHAEPLHAARQGSFVARLDDRVEVIRLQRDVDHAHAEAVLADLECAPRDLAHSSAPETGQAALELGRDEHGGVRVDPRARRVRDERDGAFRLASRSRACATARRERELMQLRTPVAFASSCSHVTPHEKTLARCGGGGSSVLRFRPAPSAA